MSFENGSVGFRVLAGAIDQDALLDHASGNGLTDIDSIRDECPSGWMGPRHLLDGDLSAENCCTADGLLRLSLVQAQRKYPAGRLKAEVMREVEAWMKAEGRAYCPLKTRSELKQSVIERLLPDAPVGLSGIDLIVCGAPLDSFTLTDALSERKMDALSMALGNAHQRVRAVNPDFLCEEQGINPHDLKPLPFTGGHGERQTEMFGFTLGREFLMWLLWSAETIHEVDLPEIGKVAVFVDGPLVMKADDARVETLRLQGEAPTISGEFSQAMAEGMLLKRARVTLTMPGTDDCYQFEVDADEWTFRGVKLPKMEGSESRESAFLWRLNHLSKLWKWWTGLFGLFLAMRTRSAEKFEKSCFDWAFERPVRCRMRQTGGRKTEDGGRKTEDGGATGPTLQERAQKVFEGTIKSGAAVTIEVERRDGPDEELIEQAVEHLRKGGRAATSSLQRHLKIGYNRAANLIDLLEERGVLGPVTDDGHGPREILKLPKKAVA